MTNRQKLQLEQSEKRQRINDLLGHEELTDEQRGELDTLTKRMQNLEIEMRAAIVVEGEEEAEARGLFGGGDGQSAELRQLLGGVSIFDYLNPAASGGAVEGRAKELSEALEVDAVGQRGGVLVPWEVIEQRAFTSTVANDGALVQRPILQRLFGPGVADTLGVRMDAVPAGRAEWPLISAGVAPAMAQEGVAATAAVAATFSNTSLKPKRLTGVYEFTHEAAASVPEIEAALRRDLADAVKSQMSHLLVNGAAPTNTAPQNVEGFLVAITAPADASATADFSSYAGAHASGIDGIHAEMETEVSSVIGTDVYRHAATIYQSGSGESAARRCTGGRRAAELRASFRPPQARAMRRIIFFTWPVRPAGRHAATPWRVCGRASK